MARKLSTVIFNSFATDQDAPKILWKTKKIHFHIIWKIFKFLFENSNSDTCIDVSGKSQQEYVNRDIKERLINLYEHRSAEWINCLP